MTERGLGGGFGFHYSRGLDAPGFISEDRITRTIHCLGIETIDHKQVLECPGSRTVGRPGSVVTARAYSERIISVNLCRI